MSQLPGPCPKCAPLGGAWQATDDGVRRCDCPRGVALRTLRPQFDTPEAREPTLPLATGVAFAKAFDLMDYYPTDPTPRAIVADEIVSMCEDEEQVRWLVRRMVRLYRKWPGLAEMRLVFCARYKPLDGIDPMLASAVYPDGIPSEDPERDRELLLVAGSDAGNLAAPPEFAMQIHELARAKTLRGAGGAAARLPVPRGEVIGTGCADDAIPRPVVEAARRALKTGIRAFSADGGIDLREHDDVPGN